LRCFAEQLVGILYRELLLPCDGMVHREVYAQVPPKVEYSFTEKGRSIIPVPDMMFAWGKDFLKDCR
jgi:DNA-binding HxlR family transcriptional regulator